MYGGRPTSSSSRGIFSAADAYATDAPARSSDIEGGAGPGRSSSRHAGTSPRPNVNGGQDTSEEEDESEDEGWNVYDDFNNASAMNTFDTPEDKTSMGSDAGYFAKNAYGGGYGQSPMDTPPPVTRQVPPGTQRNSTLLRPESFGFDVQHADRRHPSVLAAQAMHEGAGHVAESHAVPTTGDNKGAGESGIELITVPALGQEYSKDEMKRMSRQHRRKTKANRRKEKVSRWGKGEHKICGWLSPRWAVVIGFFFLVFLGVGLYFVIPRVPGLAFSTTAPLVAVPNSASMVTHYSPTNFR